MRPPLRTGLFLVGALLVGCGGPNPSATTPTPSLATTPTTPPAATTPSPASPTTGEVIVDPALLDVLPATAAGAQRTADAESAAEVAASSDLGASVAALAMALYVAGESYAVASVVQPHPDIATDAWYRTWRDDFDAGVCERAGGVDPGRSEFQVDGRTVHRSTCVGGVTIHHVRLEDPTRIVSIQGAGPTDVGRTIVEDLTE